MQNHTVGVVGGGAAGMTAAIAAAQQGARVTLLERGERVGKKILSTGNGKCNLGNLCLSADDYHGADREWIGRCLARFGTEDTIRFFGSLGLLIKEKNGYLYPMAEQAAVVLDVLRTALKSLGVRVITNCKAEDVKRDKDGFVVSTGNEDFRFDRVILACGGKAAPKTGSDGSGYRLAEKSGHALIPTVPALVQLRCRENFLRAAAGVRAEAAIRVLGRTDGEIAERGELQFTDYGISGIPVFQLSREVNYLLADKGMDVEVSIDFFPDYSQEDFERFAAERRRLAANKTVEEFFLGMLHKKLMQLFVKIAQLRPEEPVRAADQKRIAAVFGLCRDFRLHVSGSNSYENAQVCAGGVDTAWVDEKMESKLVPGLFFAGEILDVDGRCGGYNLQWAWCSGWLAGKAAAETAE